MPVRAAVWIPRRLKVPGKDKPDIIDNGNQTRQKHQGQYGGKGHAKCQGYPHGNQLAGMLAGFQDQRQKTAYR